MATDAVVGAGGTLDPLSEFGFVRYHGAVPFDELAVPNEPDNGDFDWALNNPELQSRFGGKVVAVCQRVVWGAGQDYQAAWEDARGKPGCPPAEELSFVALL